MATGRHRDNKLSKTTESSKEKACSFKASMDLYQRMDAYVKSKNSRVKSKTALIETAIIEFLDKEEPIAKEIEKIRNRLERGGK
jgi:predicted transcriptional regulator